MTAADRITFNGPHPDELLLHGATVHLVRQSWHSWSGLVILPSGAYATLIFADLAVINAGRRDQRLPVEYGPDLLGCTTEWTSHGRLHRCRIDPDRHTDSLRHLCECGAAQRIKGDAT